MKIITIVGCIFFLIFLVFPELDLKVSEIFFYREGGFIYRNHPISIFFYYFIRVLAISVVGGLSLLAIVKYFAKVDFISYAQISFLFLTLIIGPGIVVHYGIKELWERARPVNIQEFGGTKTFTPAFELSDQNGNSFVSGHASMGFYTVAFAFLFTGRRKKIIYTSGVLFGCLAGAIRIIQGAHFLSDVIFAGIVILLTIHILNKLLLKGKFHSRG